MFDRPGAPVPTATRIHPAQEALSLALGVALTLCVIGYTFGRSNHTVYLADAIRAVDPSLLARDWYTTKTLQYHSVYGWMTRLLLRWNLIEPAFALLYAGLVIALHLGIRVFIAILGGNWQTYLLAVVLFMVSAGGTGLGVYSILQDGSFLPSNVAAVATWWGIVLLAAGGGAVGPAGFALGIASLFHINYCPFTWLLWAAAMVVAFLSGKFNARSWAIGSIGLVLLTLPNAIPAAMHLPATGVVSMDVFVQLYVKLRHPHHLDPRNWPLALWISFFWTMPLALYAIASYPARLSPNMRRSIGVTYLVVMGGVFMALIFAGIFFVSERLVQASLYRFSPFILLMNCCLTAWWLWDMKGLTRSTISSLLGTLVLIITVVAVLARVGLFPAGPGAFLAPRFATLIVLAMLFTLVLFAWKLARSENNIVLTLAGVVCLIAIVGWGRYNGLAIIPEDPPAYYATCAWIRNNTPKDALIMVPPQEQAERIYGQRSVLINFKGVPQFSAELPEWKRRLSAVLGLDDLNTLPQPFPSTLEAIGLRYDRRDPSALLNVAGYYGVDYILTRRPISGWEAGLVGPPAAFEYLKSRPNIPADGPVADATGTPVYFIYHLTRGPASR